MVYQLAYTSAEALEADFLAIRSQIDTLSDEICILAPAVVVANEHSAIYKNLLALEGRYRTLYIQWTRPKATLRLKSLEY